jgi:nicotinamidase-related amidase
MINTLDFPEGRALRAQALPVAKNIAKLKMRFNKKHLPVIYVNDNFGEWNADWKTIYAKCSDPKSLGKELAEILKPENTDFFILKPKHSGFDLSPLETLLEKLKIKRVVITGIAGDIFVLFTAHDAYTRGLDVVVPRDCVASNTQAQNRVALAQLSKALKLKTFSFHHLP